MIPIILVAPVRLRCLLGQLLQWSRPGVDRLGLIIRQFVLGVQVVVQLGKSPPFIGILPVTWRCTWFVLHRWSSAAVVAGTLLLVENHFQQVAVLQACLQVEDPLAGLAALGGHVGNGQQEVSYVVVQWKGVARLFAIFT